MKKHFRPFKHVCKVLQELLLFLDTVNTINSCKINQNIKSCISKIEIWLKSRQGLLSIKHGAEQDM